MAIDFAPSSTGRSIVSVLKEMFAEVYIISKRGVQASWVSTVVHVIFADSQILRHEIQMMV